MRILLVDDEAELVSAMAERLAMRGMEADWAETGEQAMKMAVAKHYDVAVLDMKMPRIGGLELRRRLSELDAAMKFIFLSGHGSEEDFKLGSAEAESYLIKPVRIEDLVSKIREAAE
ncbi:response regulator transcription factor [Paucidesulfovibrio longus]|uniref:response regulator transcription factor n=1 Tax=Paucidesulfovibrio longus TaxID=889 RepID=UPI0003B5292F|nr:response regulator [Paucidesulfovibrio longus]